MVTATGQWNLCDGVQIRQTQSRREEHPSTLASIAQRMRPKLLHTARTKFEVQVKLVRIPTTNLTCSQPGRVMRILPQPVPRLELVVTCYNRKRRTCEKEQLRLFDGQSGFCCSSQTPEHLEENQDVPASVPEDAHPFTSSESSEELELNNLFNNTIFRRKYWIKEVLKSGGYGTVYIGVRREDNHPDSEEHWTSAPHEVLIGLFVTPVLLDWFDLGSSVLLVMERPEPCMDLVDYINSLECHMSEVQAKMMFRQLLDASVEMLSCGVFHRDIKPDNILVETGQNEPRVRFIDFGSAARFSPRQIFTKPAGTLLYLPPEWFKTSRYRAASTTVWQLGLVLYILLHRQQPYCNKEDICFSVPDLRRGLTAECSDLLEKLMDPDPESRISISDIKQHPWMAE
ncbi:hypothetical protein WMY93_029981 [Mugilogobius chulae]|uniref:Serine/threonine-protein kinase 1 n=1 Tax=Mugilogobius chulae TaxID=88201 RepID=A0AAW0MQZ6_9GOBI